MDLRAANQKLTLGRDLSLDEMQQVMRQIMSGGATDAQIGAFLIALMIKGETVDEILGAASIMRELSEQVIPNCNNLVDCAGTGGDHSKLFNVSTVSAIVAAAAGIKMAKHGNRSATSQSGSADLLEKAGVDITIGADKVADCIDQCGIGFIFAQTHHLAMRFAIGPRKEIGVRTVFNLLGPLTNPAGAKLQIAGVFSQNWLRPMAHVYAQLGSEHTIVLSSNDGLDEISIVEPTKVVEYKQGEFFEYEIDPKAYGIQHNTLQDIVVESVDQSLVLAKSVLSGEQGPAFDIVALNAGATIYVSNTVDSLDHGVELAQETMRGGKGLDKLEQLIKVSNA